MSFAAKINTGPFTRPVFKAVLIAVFTAVSLGTNYAMIDIPNVKVMDAFVFLAALLFGGVVGIGTAVSTRIIYGFVNPYGPIDLLTLSFLIVGECFFAIAGLIVRRTRLSPQLLADNRLQSRGTGLVLGLIGFQATFAFDVLTNFGTYVFRVSSFYQALVIGMITGAPLGVVHEVSNLALFATVVPLTILAVRRLGLPGLDPRGGL